MRRVQPPWFLHAGSLACSRSAGEKHTEPLSLPSAKPIIPVRMGGKWNEDDLYDPNDDEGDWDDEDVPKVSYRGSDAPLQGQAGRRGFGHFRQIACNCWPLSWWLPDALQPPPKPKSKPKASVLAQGLCNPPKGVGYGY